MVRRELSTVPSRGQAAPRRTRRRGAVRLQMIALVPLLLVVLGAVLSCTDILGIDTDYGTNPCNTDKASGLAPIECHQGACHALIDACDNLGLPASCPPFEPQEKDLCNDGFDNDCDGYTDEDECPCEDLDADGQPNSKSCYTGSPETRAVGACQDGIQYCQNGVWSQCTEAVLPVQEKCDNLDNDCDGKVDESCPCNDGQQQSCYRGPESTLGVGECSPGTQTCIDGAWGECINDKPPKLEVCDGVDNDCNGVIDVDSDSCECVEGDQEECYTGPPNTEEIGVCRGGFRTCVGGKYNETSACEQEVVPSAEVCNGLDDDCDDLTDEGIPDIGLDCTSEFPGDCLPGTYICTSEGLFCQPNIQPNTNVETCNLEDDDCDGTVDDGPFCCAIDNVTSGNETDVNCGGSCATKCQLNQSCNVDADCESNSCAMDTCVPPECDDGSLNGDETDIDCGGLSGCPPCPVGDTCIVDGDCITDLCETVGGVSQCAPKPTGQTCSSDGECQSGYCVDGFCCNTQCTGLCQACSAQKKGNGGADGICEFIVDSADPDNECSLESPTTCGSTGVCNGFGACRLYPVTQVCTQPTCAGASASNLPDYCNGLGVCTDSGVVSCNTYACNMATGNCYSSCSSDSQCASDAYCTPGGVCVSKLTTGQFCNTANECASGYCVDGYCCNSACANACDVCAAGLGAPSNGICTNAAGYGGNPSCNGFLCTAAQPTCPATCASNANCAPTHYCDASSACISKRLNGQTCNAAAECQSGSCVDGYCCNTPCSGACDVCAAALGAQANGTCTNAAGYAGNPSCGNYVCSGASQNCPLTCTNDTQCALGNYCSNATNTCVAKIVTGNACQSSNQCDSGYCADGYCCNTACSGNCDVCSAALGAQANGICTNAAGYVGNPPCNGFVCTGTSSLCPGACTNDGQCSPGYYCNSNNACALKLTTGSNCQTPNQCDTGHCVDGVCCNTDCAGSCNVCAAAKGASSNGTCTNITGAGEPSCAPFTCTGTSNACPSTCATDAQCEAGRYCSGGSCLSKQIDGSPCGAPNQCNSGFCVDGVCCNTACTGSCNVCSAALGGPTDGVCANVAGYAGSPSCAPYLCSSASAICPQVCAADNQCSSGYYCNAPSCEAKRSIGQSCTAANQCQSGNCVDGVCCDSACNGSCDVCSAALGASSNGTCTIIAGMGSPSCAPYACTGFSSACPGTCLSDAYCASGNYCNASNNCVPKLSTGTACTTSNQCQSGNCADGYCCNSECSGSCNVCAQALGASANGTCTNIAGPGSPSCAPYVCTAASGACPQSCSNDAHCTSDSYCQGSSCVPKKALGASCGGNNECQSAACADGVCCTSTCAGSCNVCTAAQGAPQDGTCTNVTGPGNPSCGAYVCSGSSPICPSSCTMDAQCSAGNYCNGTSCVPKKAQGSLCGGANECASSFCADGRCCNEACDESCESCNASGMCAADAAGTPGAPVSCAPYVCDGTSHGCPGACTMDSQCSAGNYCNGTSCVPKEGLGSSCNGANECASGFCADGVCCDSVCNNNCDVCSAGGACGPVTLGTPGSPGSCGAYVCNGTSQSCPASCTMDSQCSTGNYCNGTSCVPEEGLGSSCNSANECASGFCADGVCCDSACGDDCASCNASGTCAPVPLGTPGSPGSCGLYVCNGTSQSCPSSCMMDTQCAAGHYCNGTICVPKEGLGSLCGGPNECASGFCADSVCCDDACNDDCESCDANGACVADNQGTPGSPIACAPYVCDGMSHGCPLSCAADADCSTGNYCDGTSCVPLEGLGSSCGGANECASGFCADGVCCDSACGGDCAACDASGACGPVALGTPGSPGSCGDYVCNGVSQICPSSCTMDTQCAAGYFCEGASCVPLEGPGSSCGGANECASGFCADGVCCSSACDGECEACDAGGACGVYGAGSPGDPSCAPYVCDGASGDCPMDCSSDGDCVSGYYCAGSGSGTCQVQQGNGTACTTPSQCASGSCVDGICCGSCGAGQWCDSSGACRDPVVLLVGGSGSELVGAAYHPGGAWSTPTTMSGSASLGSDVTISRAGGVAVTRPLTGNLAYATWDVGTEAWTRTALTVASTVTPAISASGSSARLIYLVDGSPDDTFWSLAYTGAWGDPAATTATPRNAVAGDIAHLAGGDAVVIYAHQRAIRVASYDGMSWVTTTSIDSDSPADVTIGPTIIALEGGTAELMAVFVHSNGQIFSRVRTAGTPPTWSSSALQIGTASNTTTRPVAVAPLPGGGAIAAYRGADTYLYTSIYTPGATPNWSTPVQFQTGSPLAPVPIVSSPAVARGTGAGANAAAVELAYILEGGGGTPTPPDTMHHVRCTSLTSGACTYTTGPVQVSAANVASIAIASRP